MALEESDREDLLREATALVERAELVVPGQPESWIVGFRRDGCGSLYAGANTALHFNTLHELRRVFWRGWLLKAERGELVRLEKKRQSGRLSLVSHPLAAADLLALQGEAATHLLALATALCERTARVMGQVPADGDLTPRIFKWLGAVGKAERIAQSPHAR